jgi:hypothetical protein
MTNEEIRKQYNQQISEGISKLKADIKRQNRSPNMSDAKKAYDIRHQAKINERAKMKVGEAMILRARDMRVYGHPNGPNFQQVVQKEQRKGKGDIARSIINSAERTNKKWNNSKSITMALKEERNSAKKKMTAARGQLREKYQTRNQSLNKSNAQSQGQKVSRTTGNSRSLNEAQKKAPAPPPPQQTPKRSR